MTALSRPSDQNHASDVGPTAPQISFGSWAFAFGPYSGNPWSFQKVCAFVAEAGYDGIEINGFRPHPHPDDFNSAAKRKKLGAQISAHGLGVSGYAPDFTDVPPSTVPESVYLRRIDAARAFCEDLGITTLRVDTVDAPGELSQSDYETRFARLISTYTSAAARLAKSDIRLVWEFEPGFWLNKPSEVYRVAQSVDHDNFRIMFDTSHALTSAVGRRHTGEVEILPGREVEYATMLAPYVGALHLIDSVGELHDDETSEHLPFGTGRVDFDAVLTALGDRATELDWWTVDFCFWPHTEVDGPKAVPFVRDLLAKATRS